MGWRKFILVASAVLGVIFSSIFIFKNYSPPSNRSTSIKLGGGDIALSY